MRAYRIRSLGLVGEFRRQVAVPFPRRWGGAGNNAGAVDFCGGILHFFRPFRAPRILVSPPQCSAAPPSQGGAAVKTTTKKASFLFSIYRVYYTPTTTKGQKMAKLIGPLLSLNAHGTVADVLTFSKRKSGQQARYQHDQKDYTNPARDAQRTKFKNGIAWWKTLTDEEKSQYNTNAGPLHLTGFDLFMRDWLRGQIVATNQLLLETGDQLLQEDGYRLNLE
jgi:hypothetical protein